MRGRIPGLRRLFRLDVLRPPIERDVDEELAFHFASAVAELEARGLAPDAARAEAERRFGDVARYRARLAAIDRAAHRETRRGAAWEAFALDLRHSMRGLRRRPGFVVATVVTLALGVGANAAMFGVVDHLLLKPPPGLAAPGELRRVDADLPPGPDGMSWSMPGYEPSVLDDLRAHVPSFADVAASGGGSDLRAVGNMTLGDERSARPVRGVLVSGNYLPMLGARPIVGRVLGRSDDAPGSAPAVVLGETLWRAAFGASRDVVGTAVRIDGTWYAVAGVLPAGFRGVEHVEPDVWIPLLPAVAAGRSMPPLSIVARLRLGARDTIAVAEASPILRAAFHDMPERFRPRGAALSDVRGVAVLHREIGTSLLLAGMSVVLLLITCTSVANLLLARGLERGREIAVRLALGVSRGRLVRQILAESVVLALAAGVASLVVVHWSHALLAVYLPAALAGSAGALDARVLAFTTAVATATGLGAGLLPALQASRPALTHALRRGAQDGGGRRLRSRGALVAVQSALCVVLLVGAGLFARSLAAAHDVPLGFDGRRVLAVALDPGEAGYGRTDADALVARIAERAGMLPGVQSVALGDALPFHLLRTERLLVDGAPVETGRGAAVVYGVSDGYFSTLGVRVLRGRSFASIDSGGAANVAILSETLARHAFPDRDPIGACVHLRADTMPCATVVGIVADVVPMSIRDEFGRPQLYLPLAQLGTRDTWRAIVLRTEPDANVAALAASVRAIVYAAAPALPPSTPMLLAARLDEELRLWRLGATLFGVFAAIALVTAAVGLYGVLAFGVAQRRHEIGVRLALGATAARAMRLVVRQGLAVAAGGILVGVLLALAGGPLVADLLYRTAPNDPVVLGAVVAVLLVVAVAASVVPAWRASRVPPAEALRAD